MDWFPDLACTPWEAVGLTIAMILSVALLIWIERDRRKAGND